jgi:Ala-tRNA(Pro) deacylase
MSLNRRLQNLLDDRRVRYEVVPHRETVTTGQAAQATHVAGAHVAKPVIVRDTLACDFMVVIPATLHLDLQQIRRATGRAGAWLEDEQELRRLFPDCELGAMPPIGHLYGLTTYLDPCLLEEVEEIWFQGGNHHEMVRMSLPDFEKIARPFHEPACMHVLMERVAG